MRADGIAHVHGWVDDMPGLMHACDVLVQNAGGLTSLEALAGGLPVVSYRCIPGHGQTNAAALDEAGLAPWIREPDRLAPTLTELLHGPRGRAQREAGLALFTAAPGPVPAVMTMARGPLSATAIPSQRRRVAARPAVAFDVSGLPPRVPSDALAGVPSDAPRSVPAEALRLPVVARFAARSRQARRRTVLMVAAVAATLSLGIGAPLAYAYGESPGHHFGALTHYLEDDDR